MLAKIIISATAVSAYSLSKSTATTLEGSEKAVFAFRPSKAALKHKSKKADWPSLPAFLSSGSTAENGNCEGASTPDACFAGPSCKWFSFGGYGRCQKDCSAYGGSSKSECSSFGANSGSSYCYFMKDNASCINSFEIDCMKGTNRELPSDALNAICQSENPQTLAEAICMAAMDEMTDPAVTTPAQAECQGPLSEICAWKVPILDEHKIGGSGAQQPYCVKRSTSCEENKSMDHCNAESTNCQWQTKSYSGTMEEQAAYCIGQLGKDVCVYDEARSIFGGCTVRQTR